MSELKTYKRRPKKTISDEKGLNLTLSKEEEESPLNGVERKDFSGSEFSIDLNKPACSLADNAETSHEIESTCLVSDKEESGHTENLTSKLNFVQVVEENREQQPGHTENLTSKLNFVQDDVVMEEDHEQIQVKTPKKPKPKRKRYTPKVVIDVKFAPTKDKKPKPKPSTPKGKKPPTTPKRTPTKPKTPEQTKEKKRKLSAEEDDDLELDFASPEHLETKHVIKGRRHRSKRKIRRRMHWFNLMIDTQETKKSNPRLLAINWRWDRRKMRSPMNRRPTNRPVKDLNVLISEACSEIIEAKTPPSRIGMDLNALIIDLCSDITEVEAFPSRIDFPSRIEMEAPTLGTEIKTTKPKGKRKIDLISRKKRSYETALVPYEGSFDPTLKKKKAEVLLDPESLRIWNLLMHIDDGKGEEKPSEENQKWFEKEREIFVGRVSSFNARMYQIQGDRGFRKWKGSVIDSVVGVFLTQNVADHLSSSAYMELASMFPPRNKFQAITCGQESTGDDLTEYDAAGNLFFVSEPGPEREKEVGEVKNMLVDAPAFLVEEVVQIENTKLEHEGAFAIGKSPEVTKHESPGMDFEKKSQKSKKSSGKTKKSRKGDEEIDWDDLRKFWDSLRQKYSTRSSDQMDSVDWDAVRLADVNKVATAIKLRGQHNNIAERIQKFLNRVFKLHKSLDLEWLRHTPPDLAKKYLLEVDGLGLKSVECIRLLCLDNGAFPVDTNVGRIAVRLGWVPLRPLPEELQIHLLEQFPVMDSIQKYLWPRLCKLDKKTLYELHYQMITFGKVFCTKRNPNCNACPMKADCKHFASAFASSKLALPGSSDKMEGSPQPEICEPVIEEPIEIVPTLEAAQSQEDDDEIEYDSEGIPIIKLNLEKFKSNLSSFNGEYSKALVALNSYATSIPRPKLKNVSRLRTEHQVYELPRNHPLLYGLKQTETDDETQYHLAIWRPGETVDSPEPPKTSCNSIELYGKFCNDQTCFPCNSKLEESGDVVRGTFLIPCRVAMESQFPLSGTYFQTNEVFADHETSKRPLNVPRKWIGNLRTKTAYFGSSISAITRGLSLEGIQKCFWNGVVCVRGFERGIKAPRPVGRRFHKGKPKKLGSM
ncbi:hypothetical protein CCACVL1_12986 [Corchorus capsularis]|uniref:HhH-GPD domain-containing protein n=1 Tax=Corchorus capsularis TaxID=210143 RepID=A0A1R3ICU7_COCAP|nr:hypothetical protein CCACVL1_12986 [Corchorus capsularis]